MELAVRTPHLRPPQASVSGTPPHMSGASSGGGDPLAFLAQLLLPLILTILPFFVLNKEIERSREIRKADLHSVWQKKTDSLARRLKLESDQGYWLSRFTGALKRRFEEPVIASGPRPVLSALRGAGKGFPLPRKVRPEEIWAATFPGGDLTNLPDFVSGKGFSTRNRFMVGKVFSAMAGNITGRPSDFSSNRFETRIQALFGFFVDRSFFSPEFEGESFPAIFDKSYGLLAWRTLRRGGRVAGFVMVFWKRPETGLPAGLPPLLENWNAEGVFPALIPFPNGGVASPAPILTPRPEQKRAIREVLKEIQANVAILPHPFPGEVCGRIRLPFSWIGSVREVGGWMIRVCPLVTGVGRFGILFERIPAFDASTPEKLRHIWTGGSVAVWTAVLLLLLMNGRLPEFRVRTVLLLWFCGLLGSPVLLTVASGANLFKDLRKNMEEYLYRDLRNSLQDIESRSSQFFVRQGKLLSGVLTDPGRSSRIRRAYLASESVSPILEEIWQDLRKNKIEPYGVFLYGFGCFREELFRFRPPHARASHWESRRGAEFLRTILKDGWGRKLATATGPLGQIRVYPDRADDLIENSILQGVDFDFAGKMQIEQVERFKVMELVFSGFHTRITFDGRVWFIIGVLWDQKTPFRGYLRDSLETVDTSSGAIFGGFLNTGGGLAHVGGAVDFPLPFLRKAIREPVVREIGPPGWRSLVVALPCSEMPDFVLCARASLEGIEGAIRQEWVIHGLSLFLVILFVGGLAAFLSGWLAGPIVRMSQGLKEVGEGDLEVSVAEPRADEIGFAGRSLDRMTSSLLERRKLSRFVSADVLHLVAGGEMGLFALGDRREAAILVSDIRNFTTLSETHPPDRIFHALNNHRAGMTRAIQRFGGTVERFIGDAVVAVFYPGGGEDHLLRAVKAGLAMMSEHREIQTARSSRGLFGYSIGIGIESGEVIAGLFGDSEIRLDFAVLGETVSRASELESLSKGGKASRIMVSREVAGVVGSSLELIPLDGRPDVFEVGNPSPQGSSFPEKAPREGEPILQGFGSGTRSPGKDQANVPGEEPDDFPAVSSRGETVTDLPPCPRAGSRIGKPPLGIPSLGWIAFLIWLLPMVFLGGQAWLYRNTMDLHEDETVIQALREDLTFVERSFEEIPLVSLHIDREIREGVSRILSSSPTASETVKGVVSIAESLARDFPGMRYAVSLPGFRLDDFPPGPGPGFSRVEPDIGELARFFKPRVLANTRPLGQNVDEQGYLNLFEVMTNKFTFELGHHTPVASVPEEWVAKRFTQILGEKGFGSEVLESTFRWGERHFVDQKPFLLFWTALLSPDAGKPKTGIPGDGFGPFRFGAADQDGWSQLDRVMSAFHGLILLAIPAEAFPTPLLRNLLKEEVSRRGARLEISGLEKVAVSGGPESPVRIVRRESEVSLESVDLRHGGVVLTLTRRKGEGFPKHSPAATAGEGLPKHSPAATAGEGLPKHSPAATAGEGTGVGFLGRGMIGLGFVWLLLGIGAFSPAIRVYLGRLRIGTQLGMAFGLAVLPLILGSLIIIERSSVVSSDRLESDAKRRLFQVVPAVDEGYQMLQSYAAALIEAHLSGPTFREALDSAVGEAPETLGDKLGGILERMMVSVGKRGVHISKTTLFDVQDRFVAFPAEGSDSRTSLERKLNTFIFSQICASLGGPGARAPSDERAGNNDLVIGAEIEDLRKGAGTLVGPQDMAGIWMTPNFWKEWSLVEEHPEYFFRTMVRARGIPRFMLNATFFRPNFEAPVIDSWVQNGIGEAVLGRDLSEGGGHRASAPNLVVCAGSRAFSRFRYITPVFRRGMVGRLWESNARFFSTEQDPEVSDLTALSTSVGEPVPAERLRNGERAVCLAFPSRRMGLVFFAEVPVGEQMMALADHTKRQRVFLLGTLLAALLLSRLVSRRFLQPIRMLNEAGKRVMAGDFSVRLSIGGALEFGLLGESFNRMAREAGEGRLLGKFVSTRAAITAVDPDSEKRAREGEKLEAVVLFGGIGGFKKVLAERRAEDVVKELNRYLERVSRILRGNGGEIDQFIGEKVLAVFRREPGESWKATIWRALETARRMRKAFRDEPGILPDHQGIGLVAGEILGGILGDENVRLEYTVIGDNVNLASRLSDIGGDLPGGAIILDGESVRLLGHPPASPPDFRFETLPISKIKGKSHEVSIFRLL